MKPRKLKCTAADRDCIGGCLCCQDHLPKPRYRIYFRKGHAWFLWVGGTRRSFGPLRDVIMGVVSGGLYDFR